MFNYFHPSFSHTIYPTEGCGGAWSLAQRTRWGTVWTQGTIAYTFTHYGHGNAKQPTLHVFGLEEKGVPVGNPQRTGRTSKLHGRREEVGFNNPTPCKSLSHRECHMFKTLLLSSSCVLLFLVRLHRLSLFSFHYWSDMIEVVYSSLINPSSGLTSFNSRIIPVHIYSPTGFTLHTGLKLNYTSNQTFHPLVPFKLGQNRRDSNQCPGLDAYVWLYFCIISSC